MLHRDIVSNVKVQVWLQQNKAVALFKEKADKVG